MNAQFLVLVMAGCFGAGAQTPFPRVCPDGRPIPPFAAVRETQSIDTTCGISGKASSSASIKLQDLAKNNFCATDPPMDITVAGLIDLQQQAEAQGITFGSTIPTSRTQVQALGEGKLVRLVAYLIEAHHADITDGESVNCDGLGEVNNDVHIALGDSDGAAECSSVTAEISPHFRPRSWNEIGHFEIYNPTTQLYVPNLPVATRLQSRVYRITGQLFFDASHTPCPCGTKDSGCSPVRSSLWEIHPVYAVEVCKMGGSCAISDEGSWMPFNQWWAPVLAPHRHVETRQ